MKAEVGDSVLVRGQVTHIEDARVVRVQFPGSPYPTTILLDAVEQVTKAKKEKASKPIYDKPD